MNVKIEVIDKELLDNFYNLFLNSILTEFPQYSKNVQKYMLRKPWSKESFKMMIESNRNLFLGAWIDEKCVGILYAQYPVGGVSFCTWIMVDKAFQKKGIGTQLLTAWERIILEKGGHFLYLYANIRNVPYYKKMGFTSIGVMEKAWYGNSVNVFTKLLQEPKEDHFLSKQPYGFIH